MDLENSKFHEILDQLKSEVEELSQKLDHLDSVSMPTYEISQKLSIKKDQLDQFKKFVESR